MTTPSLAARPRFLALAAPDRRGFAVGFLSALTLSLLLLIAASAAVALSHGQRVMPGVSVAGISVGGLDRAAAESRLRAELPPLSEGTLTLRLDEETQAIPMADLGRSFDIEGMLDAAVGVARTGNPLADGVTRLRTLTHLTVVGGASAARADSAAIERIVASASAKDDHPAADASVRVRQREFVARPATEGVAVDTVALKQALLATLATARGDVSLDVPVRRTEPSITSREAMAAAISATWMSAQRLDLTGPAKNLRLSRSQIATVLTFGERDDGSWGVSVDEEALARLLRPVAQRVAVEPRNASFAWGAQGAVGFFPGESGRKLKLNASVANVASALGQRAAGSMTPRAALAVASVRPEVTNAEARKAAPEMERLSTWTTYFVPAEGNFWGANITIPAHDIDGKVIAPGEWFEFWQGIGPVTLARGYGYGGAIIGGRSVANGALAGGICSTSTTLFNAAMRAGLEIGQRTNHSYYIDRYPMGLDATVLKTDTYETDMTFRNDTANPIVIRSYTGSGFVRFDIWGIRDGRTVSLSAPSTSNHGTAIETTVVNPSLAPGTVKRVEYMHDGFDAVVTRWVRDADGTLLHQDTWYSHYRTVNGITEIGPRRS